MEIKRLYCNVCKREFSSSASLMNHIFNWRVKDTEHIKLRETLKIQKERGLKIECPVCKKRLAKNIKTHFNSSKDKKHKKFLAIQKKEVVKKFLEGKSTI